MTVKSRLNLAWYAANAVILLWIALYSWPVASATLRGIFEFKDWNVTRHLSLFAPLLTMFFILLTHLTDEAKNGRGIRSRFNQISKGAQFNASSEFVSAIMEKQSILVAIALGILVVVNETGAMGDSYRQVIIGLVTGGLTVSIVLILTSLLCADYSHRFNWPDMTEPLLRKSFKLEVRAWYLLTLSLIWGVALIAEWLSVAINFVYGSLLSYYYFTRPRAAPAGGATA